VCDHLRRRFENGHPRSQKEKKKISVRLTLNFLMGTQLMPPNSPLRKKKSILFSISLTTCEIVPPLITVMLCVEANDTVLSKYAKNERQDKGKGPALLVKVI
jgi:hypothetical protein